MPIRAAEGAGDGEMGGDLESAVRDAGERTASGDGACRALGVLGAGQKGRIVAPARCG